MRGKFSFHFILDQLWNNKFGWIMDMIIILVHLLVY